MKGMPVALVPPEVLAKTVRVETLPAGINPGRMPAVQLVPVEQDTPVNTSLPLLLTKRVPFTAVLNPVPVMVHVPGEFEPTPPYAVSKLVIVGTTFVMACAPTSAVAMITAVILRNTLIMTEPRPARASLN